MYSTDKHCTLVPYFKVHPGKMDEFRANCEEFVKLTSNEPKCIYYGFTFSGDEVLCREGYEDAEGVLAHLKNVGALFQETLKIADVTRLEMHGPVEELAKLKEPLAELNPQWFELECGIIRSA